MKLKSLLFGSAAALMAATGAHAAEPLAPIAEPVNYVRICDAFGTGFFYIPGTDTCLRIGGYVRAGFHYTHDWEDVVVLRHENPFGPGRPVITSSPVSDRDFHEYTTRARGRIFFDSRTQTDIGMIRTYIDQWFTRDTDAPGGGSPNELRNAFIQIANDWGTVTLGKAPTYFEFWESDAWADRLGEDASISVTNLAAVTFNLGGGVSATLSLEDAVLHGVQRRLGAPTFFPVDTNFDGIADALAAPGFTVVGGGGLITPTFAGSGIHGGQRAPDVVGNLRVDQAWGSAQVMGVIHPIRAAAGSGIVAPGLFGEQELDTDLGWAVGAGAGIEIPGTGIGFNIQGVYADGAPRYATTGGPGPMTDAVIVPRYDLTPGPEFGTVVSQDYERTEAWSVKAGLNGNLAPDWTWNLQGSYAQVDLPDVLGAPGGLVGGDRRFAAGPTAAQTIIIDADGTSRLGPIINSDYDFWTVSGNVAWVPVSGFLAGVELGYERIEFDAGPSSDRWGGMVRVQKSF